MSVCKRERETQSADVYLAWPLAPASVESISSQFDISSRDLALALDSVTFQMMMAALSQNALSLLLRSPAVSSGNS